MFYNAGYQSGQNERQANIEASHYARDAAEQIERKCGTVTGEATRKCITEIVEAERESQRSESDLAAQWKAADWAMWAGIIAGAQLIATALGLYYVKRTLDATLVAVEDTSKATKAMERQNEIATLAQRPWLDFKIEVTGISPYSKEGEAVLTLSLHVTNYSAFPAHRVISKGEAVEGTGLLAIAKQNDLAELIDVFLSDPQRVSIGEAIFPQKTEELYTHLSVDHCIETISPGRSLSAVIGVRYFFEGGEGRTLKGFTLFGIDSFIAFRKVHPLGKRDSLNTIDKGPAITVGPSIFQTRAT